MLKEYDIDKMGWDALLKDIMNREDETGTDIMEKVSAILNDVKKNRDTALFEYTEKFDKVKLEKLEVTKEDIMAYSGYLDSTMMDWKQ